jgi:CheY-like chemotaxis protein
VQAIADVVGRGTTWTHFDEDREPLAGLNLGKTKTGVARSIPVHPPLESEPDVVVTDYLLPGIGEGDFVKKCRRTGTGLLAVVVSAYAHDASSG